MKLNVIKNESSELMVEFEGGDYTVPDLIASKLLENDDVEFAGVGKDHPEVGKPRLTVKTGKKKAAAALSKAIDELDDELAALKAAVSGKK